MIQHIKKESLLYVVFFIYIIALLFVIPTHENWADEAQSWLLARDSSLFELLWKNLRYEGTPGLWHFILMLPARLLDYTYFSYISGTFAAIGIYLLLFYAPFPKLIKILLPFSYFLFFQYGIIARSYVLLIPLLFTIAILYSKRDRYTFLYFILVVLLANVSMHGAVISIAIVASNFTVLLFQILKGQSSFKLKNFIFILGYGLILIGLYFQLKPPDDISFSPHGFVFRWQHFIELSQTILIDTFTENKFLSYLILLISIFYFMVRKTLVLFLLGSVGLLILFSIYYNDWHQGSLWLFWLFVIWISLQQEKPKASKAINYSIYTALLICIGFHIYWNIVAVKNDFKSEYSATKNIASFIKENHYQDKHIFAYHFWSVGIQPYFKENIFTDSRYFNNKSYWLWIRGNEYADELSTVLLRQPDMIIFSKPNLYEVPEKIDGYILVQQDFKGNIYWKDRIKEVVEFKVFTKEVVSLEEN